MLPLLLAIAWAVVLLPPIVQRLLAHRPASSNASNALGALARRHSRVSNTPTGLLTGSARSSAALGADGMPRDSRAAESRRRLVALVLGGLALLSLLAVPMVGAAALFVNVLSDVALIAFAALWWQRNHQIDSTTASVVALSSLRPAVQTSPAMAPTRARRVS